MKIKKKIYTFSKAEAAKHQISLIENHPFSKPLVLCRVMGVLEHLRDIPTLTSS